MSDLIEISDPIQTIEAIEAIETIEEDTQPIEEDTQHKEDTQGTKDKLLQTIDAPGTIDKTIVTTSCNDNKIDHPSNTKNTSRYVTVNRHWIREMFPNKNTLLLVWGICLFAVVMTMIRLKLDSRTFVAVCIAAWGVFIYLYTRY